MYGPQFSEDVYAHLNPFGIPWFVVVELFP